MPFSPWDVEVSSANRVACFAMTARRLGIWVGSTWKCQRNRFNLEMPAKGRAQNEIELFPGLSAREVPSYWRAQGTLFEADLKGNQRQCGGSMWRLESKRQGPFLDGSPAGFWTTSSMLLGPSRICSFHLVHKVPRVNHVLDACCLLFMWMDTNLHHCDGSTLCDNPRVNCRIWAPPLPPKKTKVLLVSMSTTRKNNKNSQKNGPCQPPETGCALQKLAEPAMSEREDLPGERCRPPAPHGPEAPSRAAPSERRASGKVCLGG